MYREALLARFPKDCAELDRRIVEDLGQTWVVPEVDQYDLDDLLTADEAMSFCRLTSKNTLYEWKRRGLEVTETPDGRRYRVAHLLAYQARRRQARKARSRA